MRPLAIGQSNASVAFWREPLTTEAFLLLQEQRHKADYDNSFEWSRTNAVAAIDLTSSAFSDWRSIRKQVSAQDYLLALFLPRIR
jgi:hypothetical protein